MQRTDSGLCVAIAGKEVLSKHCICHGQFRPKWVMRCAGVCEVVNKVMHVLMVISVWQLCELPMVKCSRTTYLLLWLLSSCSCFGTGGVKTPAWLKLHKGKTAGRLFRYCLLWNRMHWLQEWFVPAVTPRTLFIWGEPCLQGTIAQRPADLDHFSSFFRDSFSHLL